MAKAKKAAATTPTDKDETISAFLKRPKQPVITVAAEPVGDQPAREEVITDMCMITLFLNEGGQRGYLKVAEGNKIVHLLHVPTLEYLRMPIEDVGKCQMGEPRPVSAGLADRLLAKAVQWEMMKMKYSRVLVSQALVKLGRHALIDPVEPASPSGTTAEPRVKREGLAKGSKAQIIADLLLRPEGCTTADVLAATNWPAVSMPQQAKVAGLELRKEKQGNVMRYWGKAPGKIDLVKKITGAF